MMEEKMHDIYQTVITLPYFDYEVPVLYVADGTRYVPVIALCEMLGLHANSYIPRWRKLVLWMNARKLPLRTATGRKRIVWCLHIGAIPLWCNCFDWSLLPPKHQEQLHLATESWCEALKKTHVEMLSNYRQMSSLLFKFLVAYRDTDAKLSQLANRIYPTLGHFDFCIQLEGLITQGKDLMRGATDHARQMVQEQATDPIIDAVRLDENGQIREQLSLPLFPVFLQESSTKFFEYISQMSQWHQNFIAFLEEHKVVLEKD